MGREDYSWVQGGRLTSGTLVLDIRGRAKNGSVPEGVGVVEEITKIDPASPSGGKEYVKLHLKSVKSGKGAQVRLQDQAVRSQGLRTVDS
jgi:hypothetical protein